MTMYLTLNFLLLLSPSNHLKAAGDTHMNEFIRQNFACPTSFKKAYISVVLEAI